LRSERGTVELVEERALASVSKPAVFECWFRDARSCLACSSTSGVVLGLLNQRRSGRFSWLRSER
jgi:hypothetical protein